MLLCVFMCMHLCAHIVHVCVCVRVCVCVCIHVCSINYCKFLSVIYFIQARDTLSAENADLREQLREAKIKIHTLQQHLEVIRGHTIGFILEQMNTLRISTLINSFMISVYIKCFHISPNYYNYYVCISMCVY